MEEPPGVIWVFSILLMDTLTCRGQESSHQPSNWWATALPPETRPYYLFWFYFMFKHLKSGSTGWVAFWILWSTIITMNEDWKDLVCKGSGQPPHQSVGPRPSQQQHCHHSQQHANWKLHQVLCTEGAQGACLPGLFCFVSLPSVLASIWCTVVLHYANFSLRREVNCSFPPTPSAGQVDASTFVNHDHRYYYQSCLRLKYTHHRNTSLQTQAMQTTIRSG